MKLFLSSIIFIFSLYGMTIDKIAIIVNNEPITTYNIQTMAKKMNISKNQAINLLINQAIFKAELKKRGIYVDSFDIDNELSTIAQKNNMGLLQFKNYLLQKGELASLKKQIKLNLEKQKLIQTLNIRVTQSDVKAYYQAHKNQFLISSKIEATQYSSNDKQSLMKIIQNPLSNESDVKISNVTFKLNQANIRLMMFLSNVKVNSFSKIIPLSGFSTFYITSKSKPTPVPYKLVANQIYVQLVQQKDIKAFNDLISKLRAKADITFLK